MKSQSTEIAKLLLEIKAVTLNFREPYRYTSGILSPIYCDNRLIISYPDKREVIINAFLSLIQDNKLKFDIVAGVATAGIPHAAWIADRLKKPMVYIRSAAKEHGKQNQIEGHLIKGQRALLVEDLISTGKSSIQAGLILRDAGANVHHCIAIFNYALTQTKQRFEEVGIKVYSLSNFTTLIDVAEAQHDISSVEKSQALKWNKDPSSWK